MNFIEIIKGKTFQSWIWLVVLLTIWEMASRLGLVNPFLLPPLSDVLVNLFKEITTGNLGPRIVNSVIIILQGMGVSFLLALAFTLLCVWLTPIESLFNMLSTVMSPLPSVAVMPLIIMWFGVNKTAMFAIIVHGVLWALTRHMLDGLRSIPSIYYEWGKNLCLPPWRMFTDIVFFAIMPELLSGIRVGWGRAWRAVISAEMVFGAIGSLGGVGYYIYLNRAYANITNVMTGVIVIALIGILIESFLFGQIEKRTVQKWGMTRA
ncbi:MAG: ABC transporter permease subunit [Clostridiales bacterium]|jgi:NitT/TauT family transport system permease protein|nr:ABC transporter permease subunit [Clostridiales bacterium]